MKHGFVPSTLDALVCARCQYDESSHGNTATCEACGLETDCELFPDLINPKKMLLCPKCIQAEYATAARQTKERVEAHETIKSSSDYFNANIPAIMELKQTIEADPNIENKPEAIALAVKNRLTWLTDTLFSKRAEISELDHERRETLIYLNHMLKDISEAKQIQLGLTNITYKPEKKTPKKQTAPSIKKFDRDELRRVANMWHIDEVLLQTIALRRKVTIEQAAKIYMDSNNAVEADSNE